MFKSLKKLIKPAVVIGAGFVANKFLPGSGKFVSKAAGSLMGMGGGEGGSGGGGGYAGGGSDAYDVTTGDNINPNSPSWAGGGSSYYKDHISDASHNKPDSPGSDQVDGYLHIRFNPYNN